LVEVVLAMESERVEEDEEALLSVLDFRRKGREGMR
jgi:hypothetical protein